MKHRTIFGAAAILSLGLCVGFTGCGGGSEVNAETWSAAFDNLNNYTVSGEGIDLKVADDMVLLVNPGSSLIASATSDEYYLSYRDDVWEKQSDGGKVTYQSITTSYNLILALFKDSYKEFTFTDGQYQCETLTLNTEANGRDVSITMNHIAVTFNNDTLKEITYDLEPVEGNPNPSVVTLKISEFGTTTVELPTEFDDKTAK